VAITNRYNYGYCCVALASTQAKAWKYRVARIAIGIAFYCINWVFIISKLLQKKATITGRFKIYVKS
jgi:hypothetical protein